MKFTSILILSFIINILSTSFCFSSIHHDEIQTRSAKKPKIIEYIESGARAAMSRNFDQAKDHYYRIMYYLSDAVKRDSEAKPQVFDLSGTVEFEINEKENRETRCFYTDEWPLQLRTAIVATHVAEIVRHLKGHSILEAQSYEDAGKLGYNFAMAQIWYKMAAEKYFALNQFQKALECITEAGEVSKRYFLKEDSYVCMLLPIIELNRTWAKALSNTNIPLAYSFYLNALTLIQYELDCYEEKEKERVVETNFSIIDQIDSKEFQRKQKEELKPKKHKRKKLPLESKPTADIAKQETELSKLPLRKKKELSPAFTKVGYISELPPVSNVLSK